MLHPKRIATLLVGLSLVAFSAGAFSPDDGGEQRDPEMLEGMIVLVGDSHLTLSVADQQHKFLVTEETMILLEGNRVVLNELSAGMVAKVKYEGQGEHVATMIHATMRY